MAIRLRNLAPDVRARLQASNIAINPAGNCYYVQSVGANAGNSGKSGLDPSNPFSTLAGLIASGPTLVAGDIVVLMPGHAEAISAAAGVALAIAGVTVIGVGDGDKRPTFTMGTATTATMTITAASVVLANVVFICALDQIVSPLVVSAAGVQLVDLEFQDGSAVLEFVRDILTTAAADRLNITRYRHIGFTAGTHAVNGIRLVGANDVRIIDLDYYGLASTAVVEFATTLCTNVFISGRIYNFGTTTGAKNVVDTVTGSLWASVITDMTAGGVALVNGSGGGTLQGYTLAKYTQPTLQSATPTAFTTGNSPITLFTVTGTVLMRVFGVVTNALTSTGTNGTIALGVTASTGGFIAATTADGTNFPTGAVWVDTSPTVRAEALPATSGFFLNNGGNVLATIATNSMTAGGLIIYCQWLPVTPGATVV